MKNVFSASTVKGLSEWMVAEGFIEPLKKNKPLGQRDRDGIRQLLEGFTGQVAEGYRVVIKHIGELPNGNLRLATFRMPSKLIKQMRNPKTAMAQWSEHLVMQGILGFSGETMAEVYEIAKSLHHERRYDEAINVYLYLIYLNPYVAWFWQGLGRSWKAALEFVSACYAFSVAINCEPLSLELYRDAVNCYLDMNEYTSADLLLQHGIDHAREMQAPTLLNQLESIRTYVRGL